MIIIIIIIIIIEIRGYIDRLFRFIIQHFWWPVTLGLQGRDILKSWTSLLEAQRPPPEVSGTEISRSSIIVADGMHMETCIIWYDIYVSVWGK